MVYDYTCISLQKKNKIMNFLFYSVSESERTSVMVV